MRRRLIEILTATALLASLAGATAWAQSFQQHPLEKYVTPFQAAEAIAVEKKNIFLLDVRNGWEYSDYHIPGAVNIPVQVLANSENLAKIPKGKRSSFTAAPAYALIMPFQY